MIAPRYSALALTQVALNAGCLALLYSAYGTSDTAASFLLAQSILMSVQLVLMMFQEQFIYDYHRINTGSQVRARVYFSTFLALSQLVGLVAGALVYEFADALVYISTHRLNTELKDSVPNLMRILTVSVGVFGPVNVLQQFLSATGRITLSYVIAIIPPSVLLFAFLIRSVASLDILEITFLLSTGNLMAYILGAYWSKPKHLRMKGRFLTMAIKTVAASIRVRIAHNIHNLYVIVGINNFSTTLPPHLTSLIFLAQRAADTVSGVIFGPTQKILANSISRLMNLNRQNEIPALIRRVDISMPILFLALGLLISISLPAVNILHPTTDQELTYLRWCFLLFLLQSLLVAVEAPFALISLTRHRSTIFFIANSAFALCSLFIYWALREAMPLYSFVISLAFAQLINFTLIRRQGQHLLLRA